MRKEKQGSCGPYGSRNDLYCPGMTVLAGTTGIGAAKTASQTGGRER